MAGWNQSTRAAPILLVSPTQDPRPVYTQPVGYGGDAAASLNDL